jgi:pimeloyl-ACP methyl ester carboxylesterase
MHPLRELAEMATYLRYTLTMGNRDKSKDFLDRVTPDNPPVLLLHGFFGTRGATFPMELRLRRDNFVVFALNLGVFNVGDIRSSALKIHETIQSILREVDIGKIDIVGHSMGGLIGLYYVKKLGGHRFVRKMLTMGTPHDGTWLALLGRMTMGLFAPSTRQMIPNSLFLRELAAEPMPSNVDLFTIAGTQDLVVPPERSLHDGATHIYLRCGHAALQTSHKVYGVVREILLDNDLSTTDTLQRVDAHTFVEREFSDDTP